MLTQQLEMSGFESRDHEYPSAFSHINSMESQIFARGQILVKYLSYELQNLCANCYGNVEQLYVRKLCHTYKLTSNC